MSFNLQKACNFVARNGDEIEKARLDSILNRKKPSEEIIEKIQDMQNEDGGFPYRKEKGMPSTLNHTEVLLLWLSDLGLLPSDMGKEAFDYIISMQREDGGWDENPGISRFNPPPWMVFGSRRVVVYHTSYCAFWLGVYGYKENASFKKAYEFLKGCQDERGKMEGFLHNSWIGVSVFAMAEGWESERVKEGLGYLASVKDWEASQIGWMLWCFYMAGIPKNQPFTAYMLGELERRQRPDGSFASEDGNEFAVGATIEAVKVILHFAKE